MESIPSQVESAHAKAGDLLAAAATSGNMQLLRVMGYVLGKPTENKDQYDRAMFSACDAGNVNVVKALLDMGVSSENKYAIESAVLEGHLEIAKILQIHTATIGVNNE